LENGQFLVPLSQLAFKAGNFNGHFLLKFGRAAGIINLTAPCIELGFIQVEFTGSGRDTDTFSKLQGFFAEFRRVLFAWLLTG
jgi:hypothetical protein